MPPRPLTQCPQAGCPALTTGGYCPAHARGPWHGSHHRAELPRDWQERRVRILRRDGYRCQWPLNSAGRAGRPPEFVDFVRCGERATDVDAIVPTTAGGSHTDDDNLQALCHPHHLVKSGREGRASRAAQS